MGPPDDHGAGGEIVQAALAIAEEGNEVEEEEPIEREELDEVAAEGRAGGAKREPHMEQVTAALKFAVPQVRQRVAVSWVAGIGASLRRGVPGGGQPISGKSSASLDDYGSGGEVMKGLFAVGEGGHDETDHEEDA